MVEAVANIGLDLSSYGATGFAEALDPKTLLVSYGLVLSTFGGAKNDPAAAVPRAAPESV